MTPERISVKLSQDEALVLYEWIARFNKRVDIVFDDQAEQRVLWDLEASLESSLAEPFSGGYADLLAAAREHVRDPTAGDAGCRVGGEETMSSADDFDGVLGLLGRVAGTSWRGATEQQLSGLVEVFGRPVPSEVVGWLRRCNGVHAGVGGIYGAGQDDEFLEIGAVLTQYPEMIGRGWLPVAGDGTGNQYVIDTTSEYLSTGGVFFIETSQEPLRLQYVVASRLATFLEFLLLEDLGDERWPFDEEYVRVKDNAVMSVVPLRLLPWKI